MWTTQAYLFSVLLSIPSLCPAALHLLLLLCHAALSWGQPAVEWNLCKLWAKINFFSFKLWKLGIVFQQWESKTIVHVRIRRSPEIWFHLPSCGHSHLSPTTLFAEDPCSSYKSPGSWNLIFELLEHLFKVVEVSFMVKSWHSPTEFLLLSPSLCRSQCVLNDSRRILSPLSQLTVAYSLFITFYSCLLLLL